MPSKIVTGPHPLAEYTGRIDPGARYTVRALAELMEASVSSVRGMAAYGWLPGGRLAPTPGTKPHWEWTGKELLRRAQRRLRVVLDHDRFAPASLYRVGCRCDRCVAAHVEESREWRHNLADERFPATARNRVLELVSTGTPVPKAADEVGVTAATVYGRAAWDRTFAEALDKAGAALCLLGEDNPWCARPTAYRQGCRGTQCRKWRREAARKERA
ncbi:hypothetical protein ACFW9F_16985 [Streptomyces sp. NPDC059506]|uniref:hypothetical protein n=1 Tax=Streptomyces sp. NPDC059506 TaxID=3347751 RepID=UPI003683F334